MPDRITRLPDGAPRPLDEWHEDMGPKVWWALGEDGQWLGEPAWIGSTLDDDWPGYHTHFTDHPAFPPLPGTRLPDGGYRVSREDLLMIATALPESLCPDDEQHDDPCPVCEQRLEFAAAAEATLDAALKETSDATD